MFRKRHSVNLVVTPLELKLCRGGGKPGLLTVFNPFDFFVICNVQIAQSENYEVKGKKIIAPRSQINFSIRCIKSSECDYVEKEIFQIVVCDVQTKKVIGRKRIIATILPAEVQEQKQECSLPSREEDVECEEELEFFDAESRFASDNEEEESAMKKRDSVRTVMWYVETVVLLIIMLFLFLIKIHKELS